MLLCLVFTICYSVLISSFGRVYLIPNASLGVWSCGEAVARSYKDESTQLSCVILHDLNETRPLPDSLEKFRPMKTHL